MIGKKADPWADAQDDGYYVSITDMLIGLIFLFIIMLMYFASQLRETTAQITTAEQTRADIVEQVAAYMHERGVDVVADSEVGVLRLPTEGLFRPGSDQPLAEGDRILGVLADALADRLPCYSFAATPAPEGCDPAQHHLDAVLIEGHTDSQPPRGAGRIDNWTLSTDRAASVYRRIAAAQPGVDALYNAPPDRDEARRLFGIAGYADQRPVAAGEDEASRARNRRVEVRFAMALPDPDAMYGKVEALDREEALGEPVRLGQRLRFTADKPTDAYLRSGWSWREHWGVWSVGSLATIVVPVENVDPAVAYNVRLGLVAYVPPEAPERVVSADIGGVEVARWTFVGPRNGYEETIRLPPGTLKPGEPLRINFHIEKPLSPKSLGGSNDDRAIGLGLSWLQIGKGG
jgi:chemotaxis protein MotB